MTRPREPAVEGKSHIRHTHPVRTGPAPDVTLAAKSGDSPQPWPSEMWLPRTWRLLLRARHLRRRARDSLRAFGRPGARAETTGRTASRPGPSRCVAQLRRALPRAEARRPAGWCRVDAQARARRLRAPSVFGRPLPPLLPTPHAPA